MNTFEQFETGKLVLPETEQPFSTLPWAPHPTFEGVDLKHLITSKDTNGKFSYHLVRIAANKKIGLHTHETQIETHEVIAGSGRCFNAQKEYPYTVGMISIFAAGAEHAVIAGPDGLSLFAKFIPALC